MFYVNSSFHKFFWSFLDISEVSNNKRICSWFFYLYFKVFVFEDIFIIMRVIMPALTGSLHWSSSDKQMASDLWDSFHSQSQQGYGADCLYPPVSSISSPKSLGLFQELYH